MTDIFYAHEKMMGAVDVLAKSTSSLQERIADAFMYEIVTLNPIDFPQHLQAKFSDMRSSITRIAGTPGEGAIIATTKQMSEEEARQHIETILELYDGVSEEYFKAV